MQISIETHQKPKSGAINDAIQIQNEFAIAHKLLAQGITIAEHGALISAYTPDQLHEKIEGGGQLLIARAGVKAIGFLLCVTGSQFHRQFKDSRIEWLSQEQVNRYDKIIKFGEFIYLAQIGVTIAYHGKGVAPMLLSEFERAVNGSLVMSSIMREPLCNSRSKFFFLKNGYEHAGIFYKGVFGGFPSSNSFVVIKDLRYLSNPST